MFLFAVFDCKGTEKFADMQVIVCEMIIYWCDLYKKSLLHFLGVRSSANFATTVGDLWEFYGLSVALLCPSEL